MFFYQQALNLDFQMVELAVTDGRSELTRACLSIPRDDAAIAAAAAKLAAADLLRRDDAEQSFLGHLPEI